MNTTILPKTDRADQQLAELEAKIDALDKDSHLLPILTKAYLQLINKSSEVVPAVGETEHRVSKNHDDLSQDISSVLSGSQIVHKGEVWSYKPDRGVWSHTDSEELRKYITSHLREYYAGENLSNNIIGSVTRMVQTELNMSDASKFEKSAPNVIVTKNCELILQPDGTWTREEHDPSKFRMSGIDTIYDPEATCPTFDKMMEETFSIATNPASLKQRMLELMGMTLLSSNKDAQVVLMSGAGRNGKGTILKVMEYILGSEAIAVVSPSQLGHEYYRANLVGKLIANCGDIQSGEFLADGGLKTISGGDIVSGRHPGGKPFTFQPICTIWMATNNGLRTKDTSHGIMSRMNIVPFNRIIAERDIDHSIYQRLEDEKSGILNRLMEAYSVKCVQGFFTESEDMLLEKKLWKDDNDIVQEFFNEVITEEEGVEPVKQSEVYLVFKQWAEENGYRAVPPSKVVRKALEVITTGSSIYVHDRSARTYKWFNLVVNLNY